MRALQKVFIAVFLSTIFVLSSLTGVLASGAAVQGAGSTWSQIAVDQWRADVKTKLGLTVNFTGNGSSAGRALYVAGKVDFAVSEIPFSKEGDPGIVAGQSEVAALQAAKTPYQYFPIVAGGTALMYNLLDKSGKRITNLQLSPETIAKIYTGKINNWNDAAITKDNGGRALSSLAIKPVYRSDGSGTSAQFTNYLAIKENKYWAPFAKANGIPSSIGTSNFPNAVGFIGQSGSDGVANYVANAATGLGAIGYVETGYALQRGFPVVAVQNKSGRFVLPTPVNVSTALQSARLASDNTQILTGVYNSSVSNAYPISSYSYMITPKGYGISNAKGAVLSQFVKYFACDGQQKASVLGYAPLPPTLVQVVFNAINNIPGHVSVPSKPTAANCNNPTFHGQLGPNADSAGASSSGNTGGSSSGSTGSTGTTGGVDSGSTGTTGGVDSGSTGTTGGVDTGTGGVDTGTGGVGTNESSLQAVNIKVSPQGSSVAMPAIILLFVIVGPALVVLAYQKFAANNSRKKQASSGSN